MEGSSGLPRDNNGWFQHHVIQALEDLKGSHEKLLENQREMHQANLDRMETISATIQEHDMSDQRVFGEFREELESFQPLKKIVYGAIALILVAFMGALIGIVMVKH